MPLRSFPSAPSVAAVRRWNRVAALIGLLGLPLLAPAAELEEVVVRAERSLAARLGAAASVDSLDAQEIARVAATHPTETLNRLPGVWISRGSGQEHLTAIRSAVLTGAGACGAFVLLEDGLPIRPAGFCNVNGLFELNTEQAQALEVWRGPGSAVLGGNALRGAINRVSAVPDRTRLRVDAGAYDYYRVAAEGALALGDSTLGVRAHGTGSNGYRDDTGYGQQKLSLTHALEAAGWEVLSTLSASNLNQETGGFVLGFEAYEDDDLRDTNPNPEAYRDAWSLRMASHWRRDGLRISPYLRRSRMVFLQHFLPGQPREENAQTSGGVLLDYEGTRGRLSYRLGTQLEWMTSELKEVQDGPTLGSAFLVATRPSGLHYDYDVDSFMGAAFADLDWTLTDRTRLSTSLRLERLEYDYENRFIDGNTRADGTPCGFGGCLYSRPASREDRFTELSARVTLAREIAANGQAYVAFGTGFRPPQATELYRLQRDQTVADLDSERLMSLELGVRLANWQVALFADRVRHLIFRDAAGFNVSDGRTKSQGVEFGWQQDWHRHSLRLALSYAEHRYDFDRAAGGGELIEKNNMMDTAPRWLGNITWLFRPAAGVESELELAGVGPHFLDAANTARYDGHLVANWRLSYRPEGAVAYFLRVINLLDEKYADRADFAFGNYRYFPAMPRQLYVGVEFSL